MAAPTTLDTLRQKSEHARTATDSRDAIIRQANREGVSAIVIAETAGLTRGRIYQILGAEIPGWSGHTMKAAD